MKKNRVLLSWLLIFVSYVSFAQRAKIDSLLRVEKTAKTDTAHVSLLLNLTELYRTISTDSAFLFVKKAEKISVELNDQKKTYLSYKSIFKLFLYSDKYDSGLFYANKILTLGLSDHDSLTLYEGYNSIGVINYRFEKYDKAMENYLKSLKVAEAWGDPLSKARAYGNLATIYGALGDKKNAIAWNIKSISILEQTANYSNLGTGYGNLANDYLENGDSAMAMTTYSKAIKTYTKINANGRILEMKCQLGLIYFYRGSKDSAIKWVNDFYDLGKRVNNKTVMVIALNDLATFNLSMKQYKKVIELTNQSILITDELHSFGHAQIAHKLAAKAYFELKDYKNSASQLFLFNICSDSLKNDNLFSIAQSLLSAQFEKEKNEMQAEQDRKNLMAESETNKQAIIRNGLLVGFAITLLMALFILRGYRQKQKANQIILIQKELVEEKQKEILDSIHYAKRIQQSLLPTEKYVSKTLDRLKKSND